MSVVIVSWILILLAAFGLTYSHDVMTEARSVQFEIERHQLRAQARSGVEMGRMILDKTPRLECSSLNSTSLDNPFAMPLPCGSGFFAVGVSTHRNREEIWLPGIHDETGRLPMALADSTSLASLPGFTNNGIRFLLDARQSAGSNSLPPLESLPFLDESTRDAASEYLSRHGNSINVNSAPEEIMIAAGIPARIARKIVDWREGPDRALNTSDDRRYFKLTSEDPGIRACSMNSEEAALMAYFQSTKRVDVESSFFTFTSRGWIPDTHGICEITVVLQKPENGPSRIIEWTERWLK